MARKKSLQNSIYRLTYNNRKVERGFVNVFQAIEELNYKFGKKKNR